MTHDTYADGFRAGVEEAAEKLDEKGTAGFTGGSYKNQADFYAIDIRALTPSACRRLALMDADNTRLREALADMLSGWRYIRLQYGDLPGVGWDRCQTSAEAALISTDGCTNGQ